MVKSSPVITSLNVKLVSYVGYFGKLILFVNKLKIILTPSSYVQLQSFIKIGGLVSEKTPRQRSRQMIIIYRR